MATDMLDLRPALEIFDTHFGVAATVTPLGGSPVSLTVIPDSGRRHRFEGDPDVSSQSPTFDVRRDLVPDLPVGSTIVAPRTLGEADQTWIVIRVDDGDPEYLLAIVEVAQ